MQDKILLGVIDLFVDQFHRTVELVRVGKQGTVGHPKASTINGKTAFIK